MVHGNQLGQIILVVGSLFNLPQCYLSVPHFGSPLPSVLVFPKKTVLETSLSFEDNIYKGYNSNRS